MMKNNRRKEISLLLFIFATCFSNSNGCTVEGVGGAFPEVINILDTHRGIIFNRQTSGIENIILSSFSGGLNRGPYFDVTHDSDISRFEIATNNAFVNYEEYETLDQSIITVDFRCTGGTQNRIIFVLRIEDTNNNPPQFLPSNEFTYTIPTPLPEGFQVTGCFDGLIVRDIDLTTTGIAFTIEENPFFEIVNNTRIPTDPKEFIGILQTTTSIRNLPESITLKITATDDDTTGDPRLTAYATVTIKSDAASTLPEDPVFAEAFYLATYTMDHEFILVEPISLRSGFDEQVRFNLEGAFSDNFEFVPSNENKVTIRTRTPLTADVLRKNQIVLVVRADRESTSGDTTTVIVQLPEDMPLQFQMSHYEGTIEINRLQVPQLILTQGYESEDVNVDILGVHAQYFIPNIDGNIITLTVNQIPDSVINEYNVISLEIVATTEFSSARTIVTLEVIKDDNVTPVFNRPIYTGSYLTETGLTLEQIVIDQGHDHTVELFVDGEHKTLFDIKQDGPIVRLTTRDSIPPAIFREQRILLTLQATKPRTVGANAVIIITLPADVPLQFQMSHYEGSIEINRLQVPQLILTQGYEGEDVNIDILGVHAEYFIPYIDGSIITLTVNQIPDSVINEYNVISLEIVATTEFSSARTIVTLEVIKDDNVTPVFNRPIYTGSYLTETGLTLEQILIDQGHDHTVELFLDGEHKTLFDIKQDGPIVRLTTRDSIPPAIFREQRIQLTLQATKPRTVGANAVIIITLPADVPLQFQMSHYEGSIEINRLQVPQLILTQGYEGEDVNIDILGVHAEYFIPNIDGNIITLTVNQIPDSVINEYNVISLEIVATTEFSSARTIVTLEVIKDDNVTPVFNRPIYTGSYLTETGLTLEQIVIDQGHDHTVELFLDGEYKTLFDIKQDGPIVRLTTRDSIPPAIFREQRIQLTLQATKPRTVGANAVIIITLPATVSIEFAKVHYHGTIEENTLRVPPLLLTQGYEVEDLNIIVTGDYASYFEPRIQGNAITLSMRPISDSVILKNNIISLEVVASTELSSGRTIVTLEIIKDDNVTPVFNRPIYTGSYLTETGLNLEQIVIDQGYDNTVELFLDGEHRTLFEIKEEGPIVRLTTRGSIPPAIFSEQRILLTLHATKPRTVGANSVIVITLPTEESIEFEKAHYHGIIEENTLRVSTLLLTKGHEAEDINVKVLGEHATYFEPKIQGNAITLSMGELPNSVIAENNIISLQVMASSWFSSARTAVTLEIIKDDSVTPVFTKPIYTGSYLTETGLTLEPIVMDQGYDESVKFSLNGDHNTLFEMKPEGPVVRLTVRDSIPPAIFSEQRILLTLQASKPRTVGANTAIVITLPPPADLGSIEFEKAHYTGTIEENNLQAPTLILTQGYEEVVNVVALGEHATYFEPKIQGNAITLSMGELPNSVIAENNIISLQVMASSGFSSARTAVTLEIIKDDSVTPVFTKPIYTGSYLTETGLTLEPIVMDQGYDESVKFSLNGDHNTLFEMKPEGPKVRLTVRDSIPPAIFSEQRILLTLQASKPRTVGANTAIVITLPPPADLEAIEFEKAHYTGTIEENNLQAPTLILTQGYEEVVNVVALGEHATYFEPKIQGNAITLSMGELPNSVIAENNIIYLQVMASSGFSSARTAVTLEIIKDDSVTPVFTKPIYTGSYLTETGLTLEPIVMNQGYDESVKFSLNGDHNTLFEMKPEGPVVRLTVRDSIPPAIFSEQRILLTLQASKPRTVGANTAIVITLPPPADLGSIEFEKAHYTGTIEENNLQAPTLILTQGYEEVVNVVALGEHATYFEPKIQGNAITLSMGELPNSVIAENNIISLQVMASSGFSSARTAVTLEIIKDDSVTPVFTKPIYTGSYLTETGLTLEPIVMDQGYDESVKFSLNGDHNTLFEMKPEGPIVRLTVRDSIPPAIFSEQRILLTLQASKPRTVGANTAIVITLPPPADLGSIEFEKAHYTGTIEENNLQAPTLILTQGYEEVVNVVALGEHATYFEPKIQGNAITLSMGELPNSVIAENNIISLQVMASSGFSSARTAVTLEIIKDDSVTPVFTKPIYTGSYLTETGLTLEPIVMDQGYDESVKFSLNGDHNTLFEMKPEGPVVRLTVRDSIPPAIFSEQRILLTLQASKPRTVGANTAIVITLPPPADLEAIEFEKAHYTGTIEENNLQAPTLILTQGYEEVVNVVALGEHATYFEPKIQGNAITLSMGELPNSVIAENNIISLQVMASSGFSSARTAVTLEIIKDDSVTPVFTKPIYTGSYLTETGLTLEPIVMNQGYDESVKFSLNGDHNTLFEMKPEGPVVRLTVRDSIPPAIFSEQRILLTLQASKPRTVGANTAIVITLPPPADLGSIEFEKAHYTGTIEENNLQAPTLILTQGYEEVVNVVALGEHATYFEPKIQGNAITLSMGELPNSVIAENNIISLQVMASSGFSSARTAVTLEIIKDDSVTPVFTKPIYTGSYLTETGLTLEPIVMDQGYDESVKFSLNGDHNTLFEMKPEGPVVRLTVRDSIPPAIFSEQRILLTLQASKPRTVGANTAIVITLPPPADLEAIEFEKAHYTGTIEENNLQAPTLILTQGYEEVVNVVALGEHATYFEPKIQGNAITLSMGELPNSVIAENNIISLQVMASSGFSSARTAVTLEIIKDDSVTPVFTKPIYTGSYLTETGLTLEPIVMDQGYDESVKFSLNGDHNTLFEMKPEGPVVRLTVRDSIPPAIFSEQRILLTLQASKPRTVGANTAIVITLPPPADLGSIEFEKAHYTGTIEENNLQAPTLILTQGYEEVVNVVALGEYATYFEPKIQGNAITLSMGELPNSVIAENNIISLQIMASSGFSSARTAVTLEIIKDDSVTPVFTKPIYTGSYLTETGLTLEPIVMDQGYDESVKFSLNGDHNTLFEMKPEGPVVRLTVRDSIPPAIFSEQRILLTLQASKPRTVGANTAIVITLPPPADLEAIEFEKAHYTGTIEENNLQAPTLILTQGYEEVVNVVALGEHATYFEPKIQGNAITLSMGELPNSVIAENNIISLQVMASSGFSSARTAVTLEIIKDDSVTPVFTKPIYTGSYLTETGLTLEPIVMDQGYDESVKFSLNGDHNTLFEMKPEGPVVRLTVRDSIPPAIFSEQRILLTLQASKPRTVGANTAIVITLPPPADLGSIEFEKAHYTGTIEENNLQAPTLILTQGYEEVVNVVALGEYATYFEPKIQGNAITLSMGELPNSVIAENNIISLQIMASSGFSSARTAVTLEIIKDDSVTPVFTKPIYTGSYLTETGLTLEPIVMDQGYDESVKFSLNGDHNTLFEMKPEGPVVRLTVRDSIPPAIFSEQRILLTLQASKPRTVGANTAIVITLPPPADLGSIEFEKAHYTGTIEENNLQAPTLILTQGYEEVVNVVALGEYATYFEPKIQGNAITLSMGELPNSVIAENNIISLQIMASSGFSSARTAVTLEIIKDDSVTPVFTKPIYTGSYLTETGLTLEPIVMDQGYDESVKFSLNGDHNTLFEMKPEGPVVRLTVRDSIPPAIFSEQRILLTLQASKPRTVGANTAIVITLPPPADLGSIEFEKAHYTGTIEENNLQAPTLILTQGYEEVVNVVALGEHATYFEPKIQGNAITLSMGELPNSVIAENNIISLQVMASSGFSSARTAVTLEIIKDDSVTPVFTKPIYTGSYLTETGLTLEPIVMDQGYDESVKFSLNGDHNTLFEMKPEGPVVRLTVRDSIPPVIFSEQRILLTLQASKPRTVGANTAIVITLPPPADLGSIEFEKAHYTGTIEENNLQAPTLILTQGYEEVVNVVALGEHATYFEPKIQGNAITLSMGELPNSVIAENNIISLQVMASSGFSSARTAVTLEIIKDDSVTPVFTKPIYTGSYLTETGLTLEPIVMDQGYDESVKFSLNGDHNTLFEMKPEGPVVRLTVRDSIPPAIFSEQRILLTLQASKPRTVGANTAIVITLPPPTDSETEDDVSFEKLVYNGIIRLGSIQHEAILISEYNGVDVEVFGRYSSLFVVSLADGGVVTVSSSGTLTLPDDETHVVLELHADDARAVLLLDVIESDTPEVPSVTFSSLSYVLNVDVTQTGVVGQVQATADNGEALAYSLTIDNAHLLERVSVNNDGALFLSAPVNSGVYTFQVIATTVITRARGTAEVHLTVHLPTIIGDNEIVVPPLLIINRDEEEEHKNLVVLNTPQLEGCHFTIMNRWPLDQSWLYVDTDGLHAKAIDREDESIAFMALSQIQVELTLHCESDSAARTKRSQRTDWLGPYDYGLNKWILSQSIPYDPRKTLVNLIVNDINDNNPIFVGKENEPITVGYPITEITERILPRSLAELKATDADIGENAALVYWSNEDTITVSPTTGFIHVRNGATVYDNLHLTVHATDQNGQGLTGDIQLLVRLLYVNDIAIVTIHNAFLDDEQSVLALLSEAVGYEIKVLRSVVVSDEEHRPISRNKRDTNVFGASLLLYVYGIIDRQPVRVDRLIEDINNNAAVANVESTISLEDHLLTGETGGSNTGLLAATIVLSVLLFLIIALITIWYFIKRRRKGNYENFSDNRSQTSDKDMTSVSIDQNLEASKPRLNIEELKRSEKRLQDMLNAPMETVTNEPTMSRAMPTESKIDLLPPETISPIIIQSIDKLKDSEDKDDDDDEFGERIGTRRKSVVTFNEYVEKIIHVEDDTESVKSEYEIHKF